MTRKEKFGVFIKKIKLAYKVLSSKRTHFMLITIDEKNMNKVLDDKEEFEVKIFTVKVARYPAMVIIKSAANALDDIDMVLERAKFQAEAQLYQEKNKKKG